MRASRRHATPRRPRPWGSRVGTVRPSHAMMQRMAGRFYLGTSGFAYDEWRKGVFYPEDLKKDDMLDYYSTELSSVEINYTFRRFPAEPTVETWQTKAAPGCV